MRYLVMIGLAVLGIVFLQAGRESANGEIEAGIDRPAPEFPTTDQVDWFNSSPLRMAALRGNVVLLEVWTFG